MIGIPDDCAEAGVKPASAELLPISALQHAAYCLRQAALIHLERMWAENVFTAEGRVLHLASSIPGERHVRGVRRVTALSVSSETLGIAGVADLVEFHRRGDVEIPYPVEYKRGKPKLHRADEVQLCAQALCLEEMTGQSVTEGALYYGLTKRRVRVPIDEDLRSLTRNIIARMKELFESAVTPPAIYKTSLCRACSLLGQCRPGIIGRSAESWRRRMVQSLISSGPEEL